MFNKNYTIENKYNLIFEDERLNNFQRIIQEHRRDFGDFADWFFDAIHSFEDELKKFVFSAKRYFVYDCGSGESDYPSKDIFFDLEENIISYFTSHKTYNYNNIIIYDLIESKFLKLKLNNKKYILC